MALYTLEHIKNHFARGEVLVYKFSGARTATVIKHTVDLPPGFYDIMVSAHVKGGTAAIGNLSLQAFVDEAQTLSTALTLMKTATATAVTASINTPSNSIAGVMGIAGFSTAANDSSGKPICVPYGLSVFFDGNHVSGTYVVKLIAHARG